MDDIPKANDDVIPGLQAEDTQVIFNVITNNDLPGADGATLISATLANPAAGAAAVNLNGTITFTPVPGYAGPVVIDYSIQDSDGDISSAKLTFEYAPDSVPSVTNVENSVVDEDGFIVTANNDALTPRGGEIDSTESLTDAAEITVNFGNDVPVNLLASIVLNDDPALDLQLVSLNGVPVTFANDGPQALVGSAGLTPVIRIEVTSASALGPVVTYTYTTTLLQPVKHTAIPTEDAVTLSDVGFTVTDQDSDPVSGSFSVGIVDDVPSVAVVPGTLPVITVDDTSLNTPQTANFTSFFAPAFGADGAKDTDNNGPDIDAVVYVLNVSGANAASGLTDTLSGDPILLNRVGNDIVGSINGNAIPADEVFRISVSATTGIVTFTQLRAVVHNDPADPDEALSPAVLNNPDLILLSAVITDRDGDTDVATTSIGAAFKFKDAGPSVLLSQSTAAISVIDETSTSSTFPELTTTTPKGDDLDVSGTGAIAVAISSAALVNATPDFGNDGPLDANDDNVADPGAVTYSIASTVAASGLKATDGADILLANEGGVVVGVVDPASTSSHAGKAAFAISIDPVTGVVTIEQYLSLFHTNPGDPNDFVAIANGALEVKVTVTDGDVDTATSALPVGAMIKFFDDGPLAVDECDTVTAAAPQVLSFDDIPLADGAEQPIPANYGGFTWTQTGVYNPNGAVPGYVPSSGANLAFFAEATGGDAGLGYPLPGGTPITITDGTYSFLGASFVSAFDTTLSIEVLGFLNGLQVATATISALAGQPVFIDFSTIPGFAEIDEMRFNSTNFFGFDDFTTRGTSPAATGNVLTAADGGLGTDTNPTDGVADVFGADGPAATDMITWANLAGTTVTGTYGTLTVDALGNYSYVLNNTNSAIIGLSDGEFVTDAFAYTITDGDGDTDAATLTIKAFGADDPVKLLNLTPAAFGGDVSVDEDDLLDGSSTNVPALTQTGTFAILAPDGVSTVKVGGLTVLAGATFTSQSISNATGTLTVTAFNAGTNEFTYTYTLGDNTLAHGPANNGQNNAFENINVELTDQDGDTATSLLSVRIIDDVPVLVSATNAAAVDEDDLLDGTDTSEESLSATGNLNINLGADGGTVALSASGATWSAATQTLTHAFWKVVLNGDGTYTFTLLDNTLTHPAGDNTEAPVSVSFNYTATDGDGDTLSGSLTVNIIDDVPIATAVTKSLTEQNGGNTNLMLMLDVSGSMDDPSGLTGVSRLDLLKASVNELLEQYEGLGNVAVRIVTFSTNAAAQGGGWLTVDQAKTIINGLDADGSTNYDEALTDAIAAFATSGSIGGAQNVSYFLSDGTPTAPSGSVGISGAEETNWINFLNPNNVNSFAIGIGTGVSVTNLNPVAFDGRGPGAGTNTNAVVVTDPAQLTATLVASVVQPVTSNLLTDGVIDSSFGADGGYIKSITLGSKIYTFDPSGAGSVTDENGAPLDNATFVAATHVLTITSATQGTLAIDMDNGDYTYTAPNPITSNQTVSYGFTLIDGDGDTASNTLAFVLSNTDLPPIVRDDNIITNIGGNPTVIDIPDYALLYNDTDPDGQSISLTAVSGASGGSVVDGAGIVTFTDTNPAGGSFIYTGSTTSPAATDTGIVTITRVGTNTDPLNGNGLDNIIIDNDNATGGGSGNGINGFEGNDVLIGNAGNDTQDGGTGADLLVGGAGSDSFKFTTGSSGQTLGTIDLIRDYTKGAVGTGDEIDYSSNLSIGGSAAAATAAQASISATTGVATFAAGSGTTLSDALSDIAARFQANPPSSADFALFQVNGTGNFHILISDAVNGIGATDVVAELIGVTSISSISLSGGDLTILG